MLSVEESLKIATRAVSGTENRGARVNKLGRVVKMLIMSRQGQTVILSEVTRCPVDVVVLFMPPDPENMHAVPVS